MIDKYSTRLPVLEIFAHGNAVEFGCGKYSTPLLLTKCDSLLSIEMQDSSWIGKVREELKSCDNFDSWVAVEKLGALEFLSVKFPDKIDFAFIDGHGSSRFACVNFMVQIGVPVIVAHDTERPSYGWDKISAPGYTAKTYQLLEPWTTVWVKNDSPYLDKLNNKHHRVLFTCHEGCDSRVWDLCKPGIVNFAKQYGSELIELPKSKYRNPQWVLFDAMEASLSYPEDSQFAWIDSDIVVKFNATNIWDSYPNFLTVCQNKSPINNKVVEKFNLSRKTNNLCTGIVKWSYRDAVMLTDWMKINHSSLPKIAVNRMGDLGDQEILIVAIRDLQINYHQFHPSMHVAGSNPPKHTAFKHKGGAGKIDAVKKFLEMNQSGSVKKS